MSTLRGCLSCIAQIPDIYFCLTVRVEELLWPLAFVMNRLLQNMIMQWVDEWDVKPLPVTTIMGT